VTTPEPELRVEPVRVINILKGRLIEEISKTALLEAALQEAREREQALSIALAHVNVQDAEEHGGN
jgi:hypothetical protein